jgi:hypothetical protein
MGNDSGQGHPLAALFFFALIFAIGSSIVTGAIAEHAIKERSCP